MLALLAWVWMGANRFNAPPPAPVASSGPVQPTLVNGDPQFSLYAPQYPGSIIGRTSRYSDAAGATSMVVMTTPDDVETVGAFYRAALNRHRFRPVIRESKGTTTIAGGRPSAGLSVLVSLARRGEITEIALTDATTIEPPDAADGNQ